MAKFSATMHYETSKVAVAKTTSIEIADDRYQFDSVINVVHGLLKEAFEQGALEGKCQITIDIKRLL